MKYSKMKETIKELFFKISNNIKKEVALRKTGGSFIEIPDRREAIRYSILQAQPGDMVAVIGKGHEDYQEINGVRHHFLDREVIEETVKELGEKA